MKTLLNKIFSLFKKKSEKLPVETKKTLPEIDWFFLGGLEGSRKEGYVPLQRGRPLGNSGVTIGLGVDLGQTRRSSLELMGVPNDIITKVSPYLGLRKWEAYNFLLRNPLRLSSEEVNTLDLCVKNDKFKELKSLYPQWKTLDSAQLTVLMSLFWQYGHLPTRTPKFWKYFTEKQWGKLVEELENFGDGYPTRRQKEADYLVQKSVEVRRDVMLS